MSRLTLREIVDQAAKMGGVDSVALAGPSHRHAVSRVRQRAIWAARHLRPDISSTQIGRLLNRDHTTVLFAVAAVDRRRAADPEEALACAALLSHLERRQALGGLSVTERLDRVQSELRALELIRDLERRSGRLRKELGIPLHEPIPDLTHMLESPHA